jgi:hypothetical protein
MKRPSTQLVVALAVSAVIALGCIIESSVLAAALF